MSKTRQHIVAIARDKRGRIVSVGRNNYNKSHTIQYKFAKKTGVPYKIYLHAEIDCLIKARDRKVHSIQVKRLGNDGVYLRSKPCAVCFAALQAYGIKSIIWDE